MEPAAKCPGCDLTGMVGLGTTSWRLWGRIPLKFLFSGWYIYCIIFWDMSVHVYIYIYKMYIYIYIWIQIYTCVYIYTSICIYMCIYIDIFTHQHLYIYILFKRLHIIISFLALYVFCDFDT